MKTFKKILLGLLLLVSTIGNAQWTGIGNYTLINQSLEVFDRPTIISYTSNTITGVDVTLTKPNNVKTGDLLIIFVGSDESDLLDPTWDDLLNKPIGFTLISTSGPNSVSVQYAAFFRIADGTETSTTDTNPDSVATLQYFGFYIHIKGANETNPVGNIGSQMSSNTPTTSTGVIGNIDDLGLVIGSGDGSDMLPFVVTGTNWNKEAEVSEGTSAGVGGLFGTNIYNTTSSQDVTIAGAVIDGLVGVQFRIKK